MKKQELVDAVASQTEQSKDEAGRAIDATLAVIGESLVNQEEVNLAGFGKFASSARSAREGINPSTGQKIHIPASRGVKFTPAKALKDRVNKKAA